MSLLAEPGDLLRNTLTQSAGVVLRSSQWGILLLQVKPANVAGGGFFLTPTGEALDVCYDCIVDEADWKAREVVPSPPAASAEANLPDDLRAQILMFVPNGQSYTLLQRAPRLGFKQLTVSLMQKAIVEWGVHYEGRRPTLEKEVCALLVSWALPSASPAEVEAIAQQRKLRSRSSLTSVVTSGNVEMLSKTGELGEGFEDERVAMQTASAMREAKNVPFNRVQKIAPPKADLSPPVASSSAGDAQTSSASSSARLQIPDKAITIAEAHSMITAIPRCITTINKEVAWEVKYPHRIAPKSHTQCFDPVDGVAQPSALLSCLRWVWRVHREAHPDVVCPYALDEAV